MQSLGNICVLHGHSPNALAACQTIGLAHPVAHGQCIKPVAKRCSAGTGATHATAVGSWHPIESCTKEVRCAASEACTGPVPASTAEDHSSPAQALERGEDSLASFATKETEEANNLSGFGRSQAKSR